MQNALQNFIEEILTHVDLGDIIAELGAEFIADLKVKKACEAEQIQRQTEEWTAAQKRRVRKTKTSYSGWGDAQQA